MHCPLTHRHSNKWEFGNLGGPYGETQHSKSRVVIDLDRILEYHEDMYVPYAMIVQIVLHELHHVLEEGPTTKENKWEREQSARHFAYHAFIALYGLEPPLSTTGGTLEHQMLNGDHDRVNGKLLSC